MEMNKSLQENSGSSINLQAEKIVLNNIFVEEKAKRDIGKDANKTQDSKIKSYLRFTVDIDYDKFGEKEKNWLISAIAQCCDMPIDDISIKRIEKGSTKIVIGLPERQARKILDNKEKLDKLLAMAKIIKIEDVTHTSKRIYAFDIFDSFLDSCQSGVCPSISNHSAYHLVDISVDSYIKNRLYFYNLNSIEFDGTDQFCMTERRKTIFFNCCVNPTLSKDVFEKDQRQIEGSCYQSCIKRKAYWSYLSEKYGNQDKDYTQARYFVDKIKEIYKKITEEQSTDALYELKGILVNNSNIASALDMYRYCFLRQCLIEKI